MAKQLEISDVLKKTLRISLYLTISNGLGYLMARYIANDPMLSVVIGPTINLIAYTLLEECKGEGYVRALQN